MKKTEILELLEKFEETAYEADGIECWSARELQKLLGYSKWENFEKVLEKAKIAAKHAVGSWNKTGRTSCSRRCEKVGAEVDKRG